MPDDDITSWISQLYDCDEEAAHKIWTAFFPRLVKLASARLGTLPRSVRDEEDLALSAMKSFFRGVQAGRFSLNDRTDLWKLLATITIHKVSNERRRTLAAKRRRGSSDQEPEPGSGDAPGPVRLPLEQLLVDGNRMPELAEDVARTCEELLGRLNNAALEQTALLKMEGFTNREIADRLGCSVSRTKQRLARIRQIWKRDLIA